MFLLFGTSLRFEMTKRRNDEFEEGEEMENDNKNENENEETSG